MWTGNSFSNFFHEDIWVRILSVVNDYADAEILVCGNPLFSNPKFIAMCMLSYSRRMKTEAKAKVVAAVWGTEFIQFLAALVIVH